MSLGERIKKVRNDNSMTQGKFAECLGVTRSVISNIELNRLAKPEQKTSLIKLISKEFNVSEKWLFTGEENIFTEESVTLINERIKMLRKNLGLTQTTFAEKIGLKQATIGLYENGQRNVLSRAVSDICREFNVNETWLRTGEGEMFIKEDLFSFDNFFKQKNISNVESEIIKCYMSLDIEIRNTITNHFKEHFSNLNKNEINTTNIHPTLFKINEIFNVLSKSEVNLYVQSLEMFFRGFALGTNKEYSEEITHIMNFKE